VRSETGAQTWLLILGVLTSGIVLVTFAVTTLVEEPGTAIAIVVVVLFSIVIDWIWKQRRARVSVA
jgi:hypothetical protein